MIPFILLTVVSSVLSSNELCPGGTFSCPDFATCCELADKSYGCCPMKHAVCCDDHIHCCPENTKCAAGICIQLNGLNVTSEKLTNQLKDIQLNGLNVTSEKLTNQLKDIQCNGTEYICPDDSTCCLGQKPGEYACCPMDHAVCCIDGKHCCPEGTVCNLKEETCDGKGFISEMYDSNKTKPYMPGHATYSMLKKSKTLSNVVCPGSSYQCPDGYSCCVLPDGNWGCCPFIDATCCPDHLHCCPEYTKCDATSEACIKGNKSISSVLKISAEPIHVSMVCPDNTTCSEYSTCCRMMSHYGCCPYPDAMCCSDGEHCCPDGFFCDIERKQCLPGKKSLFKHPSVFKYRINMF